LLQRFSYDEAMMLWISSLLVDGDHVRDAGELEKFQLTFAPISHPAPRQLLAHVVVTEDAAHDDAYTALILFAVQFDSISHTGQIDMLQPVLQPTPVEQRALRTWLITQRWRAWARAALPVRALLGEVTPPVLLAEAARQWMVPLATLTTAVAQDRLPAIHVGDRHLVYPSTIAEAQARGLLRHQRGRPSRRG
jgi:Na+-translocating ferredoxin:NAD+ oxidoreductase RnfD subunit